MIHPFAVVSDSVLGEGSRVWQFASVIRGSVAGARCNIASCAILDGAVIGDDCIVGHGASLNPGFVAGRGVFIGPCVVACNDRWPRVGKDGFDVAELLREPTVIVGDGASIGAGAIILPGVSIGAQAMVSAGAVVDRDLYPGHLLKRCGTVVRIEPHRTDPRMVPAA